jgi:predicted nucleotidyltransferase
MPSFAHQLLSEEYARGRFLTSQSLDLPLHLKLHEKRSSLTQYLDVSKDLANRIDHLLPEYTGFEQFTDLLKTKQIARTRIQRSLLHILLDLEKSDAPMQVSYARILGFRKTAAGLLHSIKEHASIPLITRLPPEGQESPMLREDLNAAHLWEILAAANAHSTMQNERRRRIITI